MNVANCINSRRYYLIVMLSITSLTRYFDGKLNSVNNFHLINPCTLTIYVIVFTCKKQKRTEEYSTPLYTISMTDKFK